MLAQVQSDPARAYIYAMYLPQYFAEVLTPLNASEDFTWQQRTCLGLFLKLRSAILCGLNSQRQYAIDRIGAMLEEMRGDNWNEVPE